jgi:hypothetical protein
VGFEPTNGGFAVLRSGAKLFIFLGDFVGLDRLTTLLLPDSVSRIVSRILFISVLSGCRIRPPGPEPQGTKSELLNWLELPCATLSLTALLMIVPTAST